MMTIKTPLSLRALLMALVFFFLTGAGSIQAQSKRPATMDNDTKVVTLDEKVPFGYIYYLDIAEMNFPTKEEATDFFRRYNTDLVSFAVHYDEKKVHITLDMRARTDWSVKDWNAYLTEKTPIK